MIDAAIVGLGRWGKTLVEAVQGKSDGLRFTRAVSRGPDKLRDFAVKHGLEVVGDLEPVLGRQRNIGRGAVDPDVSAVHAFGRNASAEALGRTELLLRRSGAEPQCINFPPIDSVPVNLEAFADAVAGRAPYPIPTSEMLDTVAVFEAIAEAVRSDGRIREV